MGHNDNFRHLSQIIALQIAAKPLQSATRLLMTAHKNLQTPYPSVPLPTLYDVQFSYSTFRYRQTTHRTVSATVIQKPKCMADA